MIIPVLIADSHRNDDPVKAASTSKYWNVAMALCQKLKLARENEAHWVKN